MKTILIVDDESDTADVVTAALQDEGYRVLAAANAVEGLARLNEMRTARDPMGRAPFRSGRPC